MVRGVPGVQQGLSAAQAACSLAGLLAGVEFSVRLCCRIHPGWVGLTRGFFWFFLPASLTYP